MPLVEKSGRFGKLYQLNQLFLCETGLLQNGVMCVRMNPHVRAIFKLLSMFTTTLSVGVHEVSKMLVEYNTED